MSPLGERDDLDLPPVQEGADGIARAMVMLTGLAEPILEGTKGYQAQAKAAGFSDETADRMAADYHRLAMDLMRSQVAPS